MLLAVFLTLFALMSVRSGKFLRGCKIATGRIGSGAVRSFSNQLQTASKMLIKEDIVPAHADKIVQFPCARAHRRRGNSYPGGDSVWAEHDAVLPSMAAYCFLRRWSDYGAGCLYGRLGQQQ